ncbi:CobW family GTP-binding protein [Bartonella vinsonii]|uniref:Cobalamin synthesis protein, P47K family n=1 Tax=Bartonella vinsonii subsp. berkhoffii str. Tweed TaxID=1094502 RepID=N6UL54_BARVB|nr:GTP-binding protein [Bartonella vinsonii]ENN93104.1 cobalamin synthesis protein, P47K family [Bartonella vinsonii subsp. berkhoffii str. Tweed]
MKKTRIPLTLITGFLGSGKTTFLNRMLRDPLLADCAVIINEFGEVGIDHLLVEKTTEGIIELTNGCLCCNLRSDLIDTLTDLINRIDGGDLKQLNRIIIETTGLADPAPILQALLSHPFLTQAFSIDAVLATFDILSTPSILKRYPEIQKQLALADKIILTKTDLMNEKTLSNTLINTLKTINPTAQIIDVHSDHCCSSALMGKTFWDEKGENGHFKQYLTSTPHDHTHPWTIRTFLLDCEEPLDYTTIEAFLNLLRNLYGAKLLRLKAIIALRNDPHHPLVLHGVQTFFHPPIRLPAWPQGIIQTRFVIIADGIEKEAIQKLFDAFLNKLAIDTADKTAILENPLVIPGMKF